MVDIYETLFGQKGNFATIEGQVVFMNGPGSGGGGSEGGRGSDASLAEAGYIERSTTGNLTTSLSKLKENGYEVTIRKGGLSKVPESITYDNRQYLWNSPLVIGKGKRKIVEGYYYEASPKDRMFVANY